MQLDSAGIRFVSSLSALVPTNEMQKKMTDVAIVRLAENLDHLTMPLKLLAEVESCPATTPAGLRGTRAGLCAETYAKREHREAR
jgi:hypothetical protein